MGGRAKRRWGVLAAFLALALLFVNVRRHPRPGMPKTPEAALDPAPGAEPERIRLPYDKWRLAADVVDGTIIFVVTTTLWLATYAFAPKVFGWQPRAVISGSMTPSIRPGDVVVVKPGTNGLVPGTLVTFNDAAQPGRILTHRIMQINDDGSLTTKGDANRTADSTPVEIDTVIGQPRLVVPYIGLPAYWRLEGGAPRKAIAAGVVLLLLLGGRRFLHLAPPQPVAFPEGGPVELPRQRQGKRGTSKRGKGKQSQQLVVKADDGTSVRAEADDKAEEPSWGSASASS